MTDFLDVLAQSAQKTIREGYYTIALADRHTPHSLMKAIREGPNAALLTEIKLAAPSLRVIPQETNVERIALAMRDGGAVAISVLTEPTHFRGSLNTLIKVRKRVNLPLLMKDFILTRAQIDAAVSIGADAILLINALFDRGYSEYDASELIEYAHAKGLEVLLEAHTEDEFASAVDTDCDLVGINNRDLRTLAIDIHTTQRILQNVDPQGKIVVSESGVKTAADIRFLHAAGAQAFLVGSTIMAAEDMERIVRGLATAV
jgi:indole-3-glycerol phosphate synthase